MGNRRCRYRRLGRHRQCRLHGGAPVSNRALIEINHDFTYHIDNNPREFTDALCSYLKSASPDNAEKLKYFGVHVFGTRHHLDAFAINWGGIEASKKEPQKR